MAAASVAATYRRRATAPLVGVIITPISSTYPEDACMQARVSVALAPYQFILTNPISFSPLDRYQAFVQSVVLVSN